MALHRKVTGAAATDDTELNPLFSSRAEASHTPNHVLPDGELDPDVAYQIVHDELMLDGNARLNLATFVTTWMEPQAQQADGRDLRQEHDRQGRVPADRRARAALREHPRRALARARRTSSATGCSTTGLERGGDARRHGAQVALARAHARPPGKPTDKPNMVMGINVQVCWEKFCRYWDVEPRFVPDGGRPLPPHRRGGGQAAATRTRSASSPSSAPRSTAATSRSRRSARRSTSSRREPASTSPCTSTAPRAASWRPFLDPDLVWDFRLPRVAVDQRLGPQVRPRLPGRRLGRLARPRRAARGPRLPGQLPRRRHADVRAQLLAARRAGRAPSTTTSCASASRATGGSSRRCRDVRPVPRRADRRARARSSCSPTAASCRCSPSS